MTNVPVVPEGRPALQRSRKAIVVADVVESVRLMQSHEADVVDRWCRFVGEVRTQLLPAHAGRLVKSLGDGLLMEFDQVPSAAAAALDLQRRIASYNVGCAPDAAIALRVGAHVADVITGELDVYGAGVNLAARLASLAGPGEVVVSDALRDLLTDGIDVSVDDLGECRLKGMSEQPVRAFRVGATDERTMTWTHAHYPVCLEPVVAVIPFDDLCPDGAGDAIGELLADGIIAQLSRLKQLRVISRLSSRALRGRKAALADSGVRLGAHFVVNGSYAVAAGRLVVTADLCDVRSASVVWCERLAGAVADLLQPESEIVGRIAAAACRTVLDTELERVRTQPLRTLEDHSLLTASTIQMHHAAPDRFRRVRPMLEHLIERHGRHPVPRAWLSRWHVLRVVRGLSVADAADIRQALDQTRRALDMDPDCSLAMTVEGFIHCHMLKDPEAAAARYERALQANPNESLAWLFTGVAHAFRDEAASAVAAADKALCLSPLDPLLDYYQSLCATALLPSGDYDRAIALAQASLRANRMHTSTWRVLAIAQALSGRVAEAQATVRELMRMEPALTVRDYLRRSPGGRYASGPIWANALRAAGVPEGT